MNKDSSSQNEKKLTREQALAQAEALLAQHASKPEKSGGLDRKSTLIISLIFIVVIVLGGYYFLASLS